MKEYDLYNTTYDTYISPSSTSLIWKHVGSAVVLSTLVFIFLTVFFYTYVKTVENDVFKIEVNEVFNIFFKSNYSKTFFQKDEKNDQQSNENEIKKWEERNNNLIKDSIYLAMYVFFACLLICGFLWWWKGISLDEIWLTSLIYLIFIGLTEFLFLTLITREYRTISAVEIKNKVLSKL